MSLFTYLYIPLSLIKLVKANKHLLSTHEIQFYMRRITLTIASLLFTIGAMAQGQVEFTFDRSKDTVIVAGADGVTATITATSASNTWNTGGAMASRKEILCPNTNTSETNKESAITFTLTIEGLANAAAYKSVVFTHIAVNSSGNLQPSNNTDVRHCNFILKANNNTVAERSDENIWIPAGKTEKNIIFNNEITVENGTLTLELTLYKGTQNLGCFYGLKNISLFPIAIEPEKFYTIKLTPTISDGRHGAVMAADTAAGLACVSESDNSSDEVFALGLDNGKLYLKNIHTQAYISSVGNSQTQVMAAAESVADAKNVYINRLGEANGVDLIGITPVGGNMLNCAAKPGNVVAYDNTDKDKASSWYLSEVTEFAHALTVGETGYATLCLGFDAEIPAVEGDGNGVFIATRSTIANSVHLTEVEGVLPANTAVIVKATPGSTLDFAYSTAAPTAISGNLLSGTLYKKDITEKAYTLGVNDGVVAFYLATTEGKDEGTFTNNANKAYLPAATLGSASLSSSIRFDFGGTTATEEVVIENNNDVIHDLYGRLVDEITGKGIYIVGGRKVLVK